METASVLSWAGVLVKLLIALLLIRLLVWCVFSLVDRFLGFNLTISGWRVVGFETLSIKTHTIELQVKDFSVSLRWFNSSCRHFFKINIAGVHVEYFKLPHDSHKNKNSESIRLSKTRGHSRKKRILYWGLRKILKLTELSVKCLEVWTQDNSKPDVSLVSVFQVLGQLTVIAKPLPQGELALSLEVDKLAAQFLLQMDKPCSSTDDGLYPLVDFKLSAKAVLFLQPLTLSGGLVKSVQLNIVPLSLSLSQQELLNNTLVDYGLFTSQQTIRGESKDTFQQQLSHLPEKMEVVLEDVNLFYHACNTNRVMSSKVTRVSLATNLLQNDEIDQTLPTFDVSLGVQELGVMDSHSRKALRLHQLRLVSKMTSKELTNKAHVDSLHVSLWDEETVFWSKYSKETFKKFEVRLKSRQPRKKDDTSSLRTNFVSQMFSLPLSVVTTLEASDWSFQLHMNSSSLQAKEPFCRVVMATCAGNVQWSAPEENTTITIKSSLRLADTYLHVPGYHPTVDNPTFFRQRIDNPQILPSLHRHLWGRVAAIGGLILKADKEIKLSQDNVVELTDEPFLVNGEGSSLMLEWSQPTVVAAVRLLDHLQSHYGISFVKSDSDGGSLDKKDVSDKRIPRVNFGFQLTDANLFAYALTQESPSMMVRLDAGSLSSSSLPSFSLNLHNLLVDDMHLQSFGQVFVCSDTANLPYGSGVACVNTACVKYDHQIKDVSATLTELSTNWTTTAHRCLFRVGTYLMGDALLIRGVMATQNDHVPSRPHPPRPDTESEEIVAIGDVIKSYLDRMPVSVNVHVDKAENVAQLDKKTRVSITLTRIQSTLTGGVFLCSSKDIVVSFDKRKIISLEEFITRFPQEDNRLLEERKNMKFKLEREENPVLWIQASRVDLIFPYDYIFSLAYDKVMNVKKFLQKMHTRVDTKKSLRRLYLPPDVIAECEDLLLQVNDDHFEIKLRANYELLCDEFEQKTQRLEALKEKLHQIRQEEGVTAISGEKVQNLFNSLEVKDSEIYCQRAKKMYSSPEDTRTGLFMFTMEHTKLTAMFDPSMLGETRLVKTMKEIDSISPFPENYSFSTLWGCYVSSSTDKLQMQLRDYPIPLIAITEVSASGRMVFAEQEAQEREQRSAVVEVGHPWSSVTVKRKLPPLKYYYDLEMSSETWDLSYGPCLEPALAQTNHGFSRLTSPTVDPSRTLPYWDKLRLLFHGPIHLSSNEMRVLLPATFNPYNSVEYLEIRMCQLDVNLLTNTRLDLEGALQVIVHTASKYDDCEILTFPHAKSTLNFKWVCSGKGPNGHHYVVRCAPDRVPVLPDNQVHDSYSSFRSQNLDVEWSLDVQPKREVDEFPPSILLYSSTLRCLQQYQALQKWNVTRPTRRGTYYKNLKPRRSPLLRHWRDVKVSVSFPKSVLHYWSSVALQRGIECNIDQASLSMNYLLKLVPIESNLVQRPRANWTIVSCQAKVKNLVAYVKQRVDKKDTDLDLNEGDFLLENAEDHTHSILLSLEELVYSTKEPEPDRENSEDDFTHQVETQNTKLLWNVSNKSVVLGLYDAFDQAELLKRDLSAEALKSINKLHPPPQELPDLPPQATKEDRPAAPSSHTSRQSRMRMPSSGNRMLDQLLADIHNDEVKYVDERAPSDPLLKGVAAGSMNDVNKRNWIVTLTNTQIALQGPDNNGYVLASSHVAQVFGREHHPQIKDGDLVSKKSWVGKIQELQYFSTVGSVSELENKPTIPWLQFSVIRPPLALTCNDPNDEQPHTDDEATLNILLGKLGPSQDEIRGNSSSSPPGEAVGGLVSCVLVPDGSVEDLDGPRMTVQLQRIASRCHCQVFYVTYGDVVESEVALHPSPSHQANSEFKLTSREAVDTLTVRYPSVDVCTTSSQYALIMDILNNLLMNKEAKKKEALDRNARMQFTLQLASNIQDPRKPVQSQQNRVRKYLQNLRALETQLFLEQREDQRSEVRESELYSLIISAKEDLSTASNTLRAMIRAFKQSQLYMTPTRGPNDSEPADAVRRIEIWVDDAHWWLTQDDGQLQVADICFTNFSYNRVTFSDDSGEHRLELGTFNVHNLMPNTRSAYQHVLHPYDPNAKHLRVDKNICLRVYCKDKAPVAGISVKEHLEVNIVPLSVNLTAKFYQTMQDFFFPKADERASDQQELDHSHLFGPSGVQPTPALSDPSDRSSPSMSRASSVRRSTVSINSSITATTITTNYSPPTSPQPKEVSTKGSRHAKPITVDAVEKMKERATHIKTFIYVKIPQCTLCVSYKSENVSLKDIQNGRFTVPTLEYHNRNWTWADMLMEVKKDIKSVIVQQTLKSVVGMKETDETAGLASPKMTRRGSDLLLGRMNQMLPGKGRKLFSKLGSSKDEQDEDTRSTGTRRSLRLSSSTNDTVKRNAGASYQPPLSEPDMNIDRTMRKLTKKSQDANNS